MRTRHYKYGLTFFTLCLLLQHFLIAPPAYACLCGSKEDIARESFEHRFSQSEAVFQGTVTRIHSHFDQWKFVHEYMPKWSHQLLSDGFWVKSYFLNIDVDVSSSWKGVNQKSITIYREFNGCEGDTPFVEGQDYLFFARKYNVANTNRMDLLVWNCANGTHEISYDNAKNDLELLKDLETIPLLSKNIYSFFAFAALAFLVAAYLGKALFRSGKDR